MSRQIGPRRALGALLAASVALSLALVLPAGSLASKAKPHVSTGSAHTCAAPPACSPGGVPRGRRNELLLPVRAHRPRTARRPPPLPRGQRHGEGAGRPAGRGPDRRARPTTSGSSAIAGGVTISGRDKTFLAGGAPRTRLAFRFAKTSVARRVRLALPDQRHAHGAGQRATSPIALQASPYPYLEPFDNVGAPGTTNAAGAFSFRVSNLAAEHAVPRRHARTDSRSTARSPSSVAPCMILPRASATKRTGFVRLYGIVLPARRPAAQCCFQLRRPRGRTARIGKHRHAT